LFNEYEVQRKVCSSLVHLVAEKAAEKAAKNGSGILSSEKCLKTLPTISRKAGELVSTFDAK
jgi:hypothetical protein